jgi:hypothetical protein
MEIALYTHENKNLVWTKINLIAFRALSRLASSITKKRLLSQIFQISKDRLKKL